MEKKLKKNIFIEKTSRFFLFTTLIANVIKVWVWFKIWKIVNGMYYIVP